MEAWRAAVPRSRCRSQINTISRRRRNGRPPAPGNRPTIAIRSSQRWSMEAWRAAVPRSRCRSQINTIFTAPTERSPSSSGESANDSHSFIATMIDGGLRSLAAVAGRKSTPFHGADGAVALQSNGHESPPLMATNLAPSRFHSCQDGPKAFRKTASIASDSWIFCENKSPRD
jgi:hypothetical protein